MKWQEKLQERYRRWQATEDLSLLSRGPWPGWRRSYLFLAFSFLMLSLLPWIWIEEPEPRTPSSGEILREGRVGQAVLPETTLFLDPAEPSLSTQEIRDLQLPLRALRPPRLSLPEPPLRGQLARFDNTVWSSGEINRLARAELRLGGLPPARLDRQMQEAILQREIETAWLLREAELQGLALPAGDSVLGPKAESKLLRAGFSREDILVRVQALLLAASLRELALSRGSSVRKLEAEWVQRWAEQTSCDLPICL